MKYKVFYGGSKCKVWNGNNPYALNMGKPGRNRHLAEIEAYIEDMDEPTLTDNYDGTLTLSFDPIPEQMATWMVESRAVFFQVVRQHIGKGHMKSRYKKDGKSNKTSHRVADTFPYGWDYANINDTDIAITSTKSDQENMDISVAELTSGRITRNMGYLYDFRYGNSWTTVREYYYDDFIFEFYIGLIYYNSSNRPWLYKMDKFDIPYSAIYS